MSSRGHLPSAGSAANALLRRKDRCGNGQVLVPELADTKITAGSWKGPCRGGRGSLGIWLTQVGALTRRQDVFNLSGCPI